MHLSQQVTSLELSQKMKELGFAQKSLFDWVKQGNWWRLQMSRRDNGTTMFGGEPEAISAYTCSELGEMLPDFTNSRLQASTRHRKKWDCYYEGLAIQDDDWPIPCPRDRNEADARAKMLIYLKENNLI